MKIERLRNKKSKLIFLCGFLVVVVLLITVVVKGSKAKYRSSQIIPLINTKVKNNVPDFTVMGIYLNDGGPITGADGKKYTKQEKGVPMPSSGFVINETNSYCEKFDTSKNQSTKDTNVKLYTNILGNHVIKGVSSGDKCHLFFDEGTNEFISAKAFLLNMWGYEDISTITERTDFGTIRTDEGNKVYKAEDDYGTSYYLVGNPQNNWVKFAGYYWRITRINGNGTLKMIYSGSELTGAKTTGADTQLPETSEYNLYDNFGYYVGYMYSEGTRIGTGNSSIIKSKLDTFYANSLARSDSYIDKNTGFCNDRSILSGDGFSDSETVFMARDRLFNNKLPILTCPDTVNDLFTVKSSNNGNKKLDYPIGLITADELMIGGITYWYVDGNTNMFNTEYRYWTMTPSYKAKSASLYAMQNGNIYHAFDNTLQSNGVRPVINLKKDITFSKGNGTIDFPFEI